MMFTHEMIVELIRSSKASIFFRHASNDVEAIESLADKIETEILHPLTEIRNRLNHRPKFEGVQVELPFNSQNLHPMDDYQ